MKDWTEDMAKRMDEYLHAMERLQLPEYIRYLDDKKRMMRNQFLGGVARGVGMAVGFTILGAILIMFLQRLAQRNLPVIGEFLAQVVTIVQRRLE